MNVVARLVHIAKDIMSADSPREAYLILLEYVEKKGKPILTAQDIHPDIPTIHNFARKYHDSVEHLGYGCFRGKTEHGEFDFDAGGAMNRDGGISWTTLQADEHVLRDLGYDTRKVVRALKQLIDGYERTASKELIAEPKPKFKQGDKVKTYDPEYTEVWSVGDYDDYLGDRRYVVMDPKTHRKRNFNEKGMKLAHDLVNRFAQIVEKVAYGYHKTYSGDPYWLTLKYPGYCNKCHKALARGERAYYYPRTRSMFGESCGHGQEAEQDFHNQVEMEEGHLV